MAENSSRLTGPFSSRPEDASTEPDALPPDRVTRRMFRIARREQHLSPEDVAHAALLDEKTYRAFERGETSLSEPEVRGIARFLGVDLSTEGWFHYAHVGLENDGEWLREHLVARNRLYEALLAVDPVFAALFSEGLLGTGSPGRGGDALSVLNLVLAQMGTQIIQVPGQVSHLKEELEQLRQGHDNLRREHDRLAEQVRQLRNVLSWILEAATHPPHRPGHGRQGDGAGAVGAEPPQSSGDSIGEPPSEDKTRRS